jgi:hypothetical protein
MRFRTKALTILLPLVSIDLIFSLIGNYYLGSPCSTLIIFISHYFLSDVLFFMIYLTISTDTSALYDASYTMPLVIMNLVLDAIGHIFHSFSAFLHIDNIYWFYLIALVIHFVIIKSRFIQPKSQIQLQ